MRRWKYKEKRPTKVTIYNQYSARYRMSRAGVMREEEEEEERTKKRTKKRKNDSNDARRNRRSGTETAIY